MMNGSHLSNSREIYWKEKSVFLEYAEKWGKESIIAHNKVQVFLNP